MSALVEKRQLLYLCILYLDVFSCDNPEFFGDLKNHVEIGCEHLYMLYLKCCKLQRD